MKTAIITGVYGQDGAYLSEHLLKNGYRVIGWGRRNSSKHNLSMIGVANDIEHVEIDICDPHHVRREIERASPDEIYNLAAQSHVGLSFKNPMQTCQVNYGGYLNILLAARSAAPHAKIYQAGTSEMFGYAAESICTERTPFAPMSPYAISKVASHWAGVNARIEAEQFVCNGILFNHESPFRGKDFVTRKVSDFVRRYGDSSDNILLLGNLDSQRDWGHAKDYVRAMHLMMQYKYPDDYIVASRKSFSIRTLVKTAFCVIGKDIEFDGSGKNEVGLVDGKVRVAVCEDFYRPNDLKYLRGDPSKAASVLGWKPEISFEQLIEEMVEA